MWHFNDAADLLCQFRDNEPLMLQMFSQTKGKKKKRKKKSFSCMPFPNYPIKQIVKAYK